MARSCPELWYGVSGTPGMFLGGSRGTSLCLRDFLRHVGAARPSLDADSVESGGPTVLTGLLLCEVHLLGVLAGLLPTPLPLDEAPSSRDGLVSSFGTDGRADPGSPAHRGNTRVQEPLARTTAICLVALSLESPCSGTASSQERPDRKVRILVGCCPFWFTWCSVWTC